jgi:hypothetical protein
MVSYGIMIIIVVVFFAGIGIGYVIFPSSTPTAPMMTPQQMMNDPQVMDSWMDTISNKPELRQQMISKLNQETMEELQELEESTLLEKQDLRAILLNQMETHNQNLANLAPIYTDDPNLNEMMTEKMIEHNQLMNQLLNQEIIGVELDESIKKHVEEHQLLAEQITSLNQNR